ncbi:hypothetical protein EVAR_55997_1 [Eumeta japonica]|uniref:Uncharacterized protein n=1 Tax=Eumeta variegata TaxID=151549 RepID=A0A4C1YVF7_EUMVA|nr:hypothetical protein EVAR_55997_1 [Eumeta japonica]
MAKYGKSRLHFDVDSLENIILKIGDRYDIKVVMCDEEDSQMRTLLLTSGLALLGGFVGRKLQGGHAGAVVGGAVGAACGLCIAAVSMRNVWQDLKEDSGVLLKRVYKHLLKLNITDYYDIENTMQCCTPWYQKLPGQERRCVYFQYSHVIDRHLVILDSPDGKKVLIKVDSNGQSSLSFCDRRQYVGRSLEGEYRTQRRESFSI